MKKCIEVPYIPMMEQTAREKALLDVIDRQQGMIDDLVKELESLKEEIKRLKGHKGKPKIKPSKMNKGNKGSSANSQKRAGSNKREKTDKLTIHEEKTIVLEDIPEGSRFKGYQYYTVQELVLEIKNTKYCLERWQFPDGSNHVAALPAEIAGYHFGPVLRSFIDYQYHHQRVTQLLLLEQLRDYGLDISTGELNRLITEGKESFHQEKTDILPAGISASTYVHVDDTGSRHGGKNGYCTHIGNELFAWFESTSSKSRINFLELLQMGNKEYIINNDALDYMVNHKLPNHPLNLLQANRIKIDTTTEWENYLNFLEIKNPRHRKIATEGALIGGIFSRGFYIKIVSDDAGQFNVFQHALCWIHAERKINELVPLHDGHAKDIQAIRSIFWEIYNLLKDYKLNPMEALKIEIEKKFDGMCNVTTSYQLLNNVLKRLMKNKKELLLVLEHADLPLHNNLSERDIREYVTKRKISGGTRSNAGRQCRDTFASLKKTCRKLKVNFWGYLLDRHGKKFNIPWLAVLINSAVTPA
jgi:hypothetical protein